MQRTWVVFRVITTRGSDPASGTWICILACLSFSDTCSLPVVPQNRSTVTWYQLNWVWGRGIEGRTPIRRVADLGNERSDLPRPAAHDPLKYSQSASSLFTRSPACCVIGKSIACDEDPQHCLFSRLLVYHMHFISYCVQQKYSACLAMHSLSKKHASTEKPSRLSTLVVCINPHSFIIMLAPLQGLVLWLWSPIPH